ncbi:ABC transporter ATP-binding protein [Mesorhizobium sp. YM1C-6-2]|uniref:ABC transporter ATP-binding protein n=1 Tax=Mesorhizobium sp. YM1C-6-2 TaxID=1827501 RepID=UPI000EF1FB52|nr:ABC transporter ATP-binding protein [Mesorhizobium sp. YM1C-6-2]RLP27926.1 ABC transporter ATP-binding protein [Mesorhizobium sp. YM1C-6-2]
MTGPLVEIRKVSHSFGSHKALDDVSLNVESGSYTVLLGPSGSGKTTLLSIIGGFVHPSEGGVVIRGNDFTRMPPARRPTATVFQDYALFPHLSVGNNVGFGLRMRGAPRAKRIGRARDILAMVGLADAFGKMPHQLSGGQRQRVALARALVVEPAVLLLDEPLGALDLKLRRQMQDELKALQKRVGTAFIHVTHDQEEAMALADHCVVMNNGRIEDQGPPERVYSRPASRFSATFMGESTLLSGKVLDLGMDEIRIDTQVGPVSVQAAGEPGFDVSLAIRPEHITLAPQAGSISLGEAKVVDVVFQGSFKRVSAVSIKSPDVSFIAKVRSNQPVAVGDTVELHAVPGDMIILSR